MENHGASHISIHIDDLPLLCRAFGGYTILPVHICIHPTGPSAVTQSSLYTFAYTQSPF